MKTDEADMVLETAKQLADVVARTFGIDCEVAVHDLRRPQRSLIHLANGHVTGRSLGSPIRDLFFRVLPGLGEGQDALENYLTVLEDGRRLKSTSVLLRDRHGEAVGAFCINLDVSNLEAGAAALIRLARIQQPSLEEIDESDIDAAQESRDTEVAEVLESLIANVVRDFAKPPEGLSRTERLQAVRFLHDKGAFLIKGSVAMVAERLAVSEPTIYRYLDAIKGHPDED